MSDIAIKVESLGKLYRLGEVGTGTLNQDLKRWWATTRGKEDPFAIIGETNDRTQKGKSQFVWALKDVSFELKQGQVLGIVGHNGAGKSTLLKLLSKVTAPSTGNIKINGRIASLLEVGTGFHPDLTGRENVYLNGAILGMTKEEIRKKFDEIVDFAGVERYIDTPVKRYSSGMYVRLAFAVAAFLEPEILIIDEVLAVGDTEFQKKCLGRMKEVSVNDGRTVLFVSHNMTAVKNLCNSTILLSKGGVERYGNTNEIVECYLQSYLNSKLKNEIHKSIQIDGKEILLERAEISMQNELLYIEEEVNLVFHINFLHAFSNISYCISICDEEGNTIFANNSDVLNFEKGKYIINYQIPNNLLNNNKYTAVFQMFQNVSNLLVKVDNILTFEMHEKIRKDDYLGKWGGQVRPVTNWKVYKI